MGDKSLQLNLKSEFFIKVANLEAVIFWAVHEGGEGQQHRELAQDQPCVHSK